MDSNEAHHRNSIDFRNKIVYFLIWIVAKLSVPNRYKLPNSVQLSKFRARTHASDINHISRKTIKLSSVT